MSFVFETGGYQDFLPSSQDISLLAGRVTSGVNVISFFETPWRSTLRWSVSSSALGRGVPHGTRLTATASGLASIVQAVRRL
jgi:hypothetical protein